MKRTLKLVDCGIPRDFTRRVHRLLYTIFIGNTDYSMTWIKAPQDDTAVRQIRRTNDASYAIKNPANVVGGENNKEHQAQVNLNVNFKQHERRKTDRRKQDRRQRNDPVVLNTRMQHDRRRGDRRHEENFDQAVKHIDKYC